MNSNDAGHGITPTTWRWMAIVVVGSLLLQCLTMTSEVNLYDEGLALYGGDRVAGGGVPYRDFWSLYGPAGFYVLGGVFKLFGASVLAERAVDALYRTAIVLLVFVIASRLTARTFAVAAAVVALILLIADDNHGAPISAATAGALAAVLLTDRNPSFRSTRQWFVAGACAALTAAYRTDVGVYACIACASGWFMTWRVAGFPTRPLRGNAAMRDLAALILGAALVALAWIAPLLIAVPLSDLIADFVSIPFKVYPKVRSLPFPGISPLHDAFASGHLGALTKYIVYVPFIVVVAAALRFATIVRTSRTVAPDPDSPRRQRLPLLFALLVLSLLLILKGWTRTSVSHMTPALCASAILLAWLAGNLRTKTMRMIVIVLAVAVATEVVQADIWTRPLQRIAVTGRALAEETGLPGCEATPGDRLRCFHLRDGASQTADWIDRHSRPGDAVYIGSVRHDKLFINAVTLYFATDRSSSTKWHDLHPGVQTTLPIQREMIAAFAKRPPTLVVLDKTYDKVAEPNASARSSGVHVLDDWIAAHYQTVFTSGEYTVLRPVASS